MKKLFFLCFAFFLFIPNIFASNPPATGVPEEMIRLATLQMPTLDNTWFSCSETVAAQASANFVDCDTGETYTIIANASCSKTRDTCFEAYMAAWLCANGKAQDAVTEEMPAPCD